MSAHIENGAQMVSAASLSEFVARLFSAAGLSSAAAATVARGLVEADLEGLPSHGVMLVDMYIEPAAERLRVHATKRLPSYRNDKARSSSTPGMPLAS